MLRHSTVIAVVVAFVVGFTAPPAGVSPDDLDWSVPGHAQENNPVGSLNWLPPNANEAGDVGFGEQRMIVLYDHSLDADGAPTDLIAAGPFGMKISTTALVHVSTGEPFPLTMVDQSPFVSTLETGQGAPDGADDYFMGVAGDVRDGACSNLEDGDATDMSTAFTTTFTTTNESATPQLDECQLASTTDNGDGTFTHTITTYVPGFWVDVKWRLDTPPLDNTGYTFAEVWYSAMVDTDGEDGEFYETADTIGQSTSTGGPHNFDLTLTLTANPGGMSLPECYDWTPQNVPGSVDERTIDLSQYAGSEISVGLWNKGDWDLFVEGPDGGGGNGGGGLMVGEVWEGSFTPGDWTIRGCNFAGEYEVLVTIGID